MSTLTNIKDAFTQGHICGSLTAKYLQIVGDYKLEKIFKNRELPRHHYLKDLDEYTFLVHMKIKLFISWESIYDQ